jgi:hypothetical protein
LYFTVNEIENKKNITTIALTKIIKRYQVIKNPEKDTMLGT